MKLFNISIPKELQRPINDVNSVLLNKAWVVFSDDDVKKVLIFQDKGDVLVSSNGNVSKGTWDYIPQNNAVIISSQEGSKMFHPIYSESGMLVLQQDGKQDSLFLIDERYSRLIPHSSVSELDDYFAAKEEDRLSKLKEEERAIRKKQEDDKKKKEEEERIRQIEEETRKEELRIRIQAIAETKRPRKIMEILFITFHVLLVIISIILFILSDNLDLCLAGFIASITSLLIHSVGPFGDIKTYFIERRMTLNELSESDNNSYQKANRLKVFPLIIRGLGWFLGIASTLFAWLKFDFGGGYWQYLGVFVGSYLSFCTWELFGVLLSGPVEKNLFGKTLPSCFWTSRDT